MVPRESVADHFPLTVSVSLIPLEVGASTRKFTLNPDHDSITVGRASRTSNKGLHAGSDNTWFDSPIMSRQHASFIIDLHARVCHNSA